MCLKLIKYAWNCINQFLIKFLSPHVDGQRLMMCINLICSGLWLRLNLRGGIRRWRKRRSRRRRRRGCSSPTGWRTGPRKRTWPEREFIHQLKFMATVTKISAVLQNKTWLKMLDQFYIRWYTVSTFNYWMPLHFWRN